MKKKKKTNFSQENDPFVVQEGKFRFGQLKDPAFYSEWTEYAFISENENREVVGQTFDFKQLKIIKIILVVFFAILFIRIFWLQVFQFDHYYSLAQINRSRQEIVEANRGIFYDRHGEALVRNTANFVLSIRLIDLPSDELERDKVIRDISQILDNNDRANNNQFIISDGPSFVLIKEALSNIRYGSLESYQEILILDDIDYETALELILESENIPGLIISNKIKRQYIPIIEDNLFTLSHVLGYTGKISKEELVNLNDAYSLIDYLGKTGLEKVWEQKLRGQNGFKSFEVNAYGKKGKLIKQTPAIDGYNLQLSLDLKLQNKIEEILMNHLDYLDLEKASVIVSNPQNGEILAMVSWPSYNNNIFAQGISFEQYQELINNPNRPLFNRSIGGEYPAGSTIKPIISAAALEEGIITENTSFLSTGGIRIDQWFFPDWLSGGHGRVDVKKAIADSVNTFYYYIGGGYQDFKGLGLENLVKYSRLFGLGEKTNIDLLGEASGLVPTREWQEKVKQELWYIGNTYHFSIGQGDVLVTPLQMLNAIAAIANGGTLYQPHLVTQIRNSDGKIIEEIEKNIIRQDFINDYNLKVVRQGMRQAVTHGSARRLQWLNVDVAGKTGTAQWSSQKSPHAWFTGFAPYEKPEIAFVILVEEGREGSEVSVSIAHDILNWYFSEENN
jgi:penicillin-binding protein 2